MGGLGRWGNVQQTLQTLGRLTSGVIRFSGLAKQIID